VTFLSGAEWRGVTATSISSLSADPPTILVCLDRAASAVQHDDASVSFGVSVLAASHAELADQFGGGAAIETSAKESEGSWVATPQGVIFRSDAVAALECEREDVIERYGRAILIGRVRNVFTSGGSGALVLWRGSYNSIGWTDDEVRRAVGLFPATR